jgi:hypothetical protein
MSKVSEPAPLRDRTSLAAVLCLLFDLNRSEGQILGQLLQYDYSTGDELRAAASNTDQPTTIGTLRVSLSGLRRKLKSHDIQITTIPTLGYGLEPRARDRVYRHIARHRRTSERANLEMYAE